MSEEEDIESKSADDSPKPPENENISELQSINYQPQTENMEVHKHPHHVTHKKKWGEYLLEFLMLFLAVFLGFVAENIRENSVETHRAKEYAISLIKDLENDSLQLRQNIDQNKQILASFDSISLAVHQGIAGNKVKGAFYLYCHLGCISPTLVWNNASLI